jgi:hypothetical protein
MTARKRPEELRSHGWLGTGSNVVSYLQEIP